MNMEGSSTLYSEDKINNSMEEKIKIQELLKKVHFATARRNGYPDDIIEKAWLMRQLAYSNFSEKSWEDWLRDCDGGQ
jgi:hypothetical protein